jgi:SAM-dependent methyltransferase
VLEHVTDDAAAAAEISRVLKPGGLLVASVPTPPAVFDPAHVREGYTRPQLDRLFGAASLEILDQRFSMFAVFQFVLRSWREGRMPLAAILVLAWVDRWTQSGPPMDIAVLARRVDIHAAATSHYRVGHRS